MTQVDVKNLGSMVLIMSMLIPIVSVGDMVNVFIADGKAGFFKVSASLPVSMKKRMLSRFLTIYALFVIGATVDIVLAMVLSSLTDIMGFGSFLGIIVSSASLLSIYSAFLILYCVILGYGKEQYAPYLSLLTIALSFVIIKFKSVKFVIIHVLGDGDELHVVHAAAGPLTGRRYLFPDLGDVFSNAHGYAPLFDMTIFTERAWVWAWAWGQPWARG